MGGGSAGFLQRYAWEAWHFGFTLNPGSSSLGYRNRGDGKRSGTLPAFVPARFAPAIARAAQRWSVRRHCWPRSSQESRFNPVARSGAGARGSRSSCRARPRLRPRNPFDADLAIDAQAHLMRDLLRAFGVGPARAGRLQRRPAPRPGVRLRPAIPETQSYVADILGLLHGAGDPSGDRVGGLEVRLVR